MMAVTWIGQRQKTVIFVAHEAVVAEFELLILFEDTVTYEATLTLSPVATATLK
jgi:hypothetical protein